MAKKWVIMISILMLFFVGNTVSAKTMSIESVNGVNSMMASMPSPGVILSCDGALGNPSDENSVAWLLQQILNFIKGVGPLLVVVLSSIDFAKVIIKSDDDSMAKAQKKLGMRLILAASLFFIPTLVQVLLDVFGLTSDPTCGIR